MKKKSIAYILMVAYEYEILHICVPKYNKIYIAISELRPQFSRDMYDLRPNY